MLLPMNQFKTPSFKRLQQEWYKKLEESGFQDAEYYAEGIQDFQLKISSYEIEKKSDTEVVKNNQAFFEAAQSFLNTHKFDSERDKEIWRQYTDGIPVRHIVSKRVNAEKNGKTELSKNRIFRIIEKYRKIMLEKLK